VTVVTTYFAAITMASKDAQKTVNAAISAPNAWNPGLARMHQKYAAFQQLEMYNASRVVAKS
jgi:hypothetical protein